MFFGSGVFRTCHMVGGRGTRERAGPFEHRRKDAAGGPTAVAKRSEREYNRGIRDGVGPLNDGRTLKGFLRAQGSHDVVLQTNDGKLRPLTDGEYKTVTLDGRSAMGVYQWRRRSSAICWPI